MFCVSYFNTIFSFITLKLSRFIPKELEFIWIQIIKILFIVYIRHFFHKDKLVFFHIFFDFALYYYWWILVVQFTLSVSPLVSPAHISSVRQFITQREMWFSQLLFKINGRFFCKDSYFNKHPDYNLLRPSVCLSCYTIWISKI